MKNFAANNQCIVSRGAARIKLAGKGRHLKRRVKEIEARQNRSRAQQLAKVSTGKKL